MMKHIDFLHAPHRCHWRVWLLWAAALWLLLGAGAWYGVLSDLHEAYTQAQQQEQQLRSDYRLYSAQTAQIRVAMRQAAPKGSETLPEKADIPALLETLQSLAQEHGISLTDIQPQPPQPQGGAYRLPFRLNISGTFPAMVGFCHGLAQRQIEANAPEIYTADNGTLQMSLGIAIRQTAAPLLGNLPVQAASAAVENSNAEDGQ